MGVGISCPRVDFFGFGLFQEALNLTSRDEAVRVILDADPETGMGVEPYSRMGAKRLKSGSSFYKEARIPKELYNRYCTTRAAFAEVQKELGIIFDTSLTSETKP